VVHSLPLISRLRQNINVSKLDWLTGPKGIELLSLARGIDNVYLLNWKNIVKLRQERYDYVLDVQGLFKTGLIAKLINPKTVVGFKGTREFADLFYDIKVDAGKLFDTKKHIIDLNLELLSVIGSSPNLPNGKELFSLPEPDKTNLTSSRKKVLILPSTTWASKLWGLNYWFELICYLEKSFDVSIAASKHDEEYLLPLIEKLKSQNVQFRNYIGKTNIQDLICLIQSMNLVIGLDSGGLHLASAIGYDFGNPQVIGIYGSTSVSRNGPYGFIQNCISLSELECIACRKKKCPLFHHKCMVELVPDLVIQKVSSVLNKTYAK